MLNPSFLIYEPQIQRQVLTVAFRFVDRWCSSIVIDCQSCFSAQFTKMLKDYICDTVLLCDIFININYKQ